MRDQQPSLVVKRVLLVTRCIAAVTLAACGDNGPRAIANITIEPSAPTMFSGDTLRFRAIPTDSSGHAIAGLHVVWKSLNDTTLRIDSTGLAIAGLVATSANTLVIASI